jgi:hypothetical protein
MGRSRGVKRQAIGTPDRHAKGALTHVWTAPASQGFFAARTGLVDCGHVSGL